MCEDHGPRGSQIRRAAVSIEPKKRYRAATWSSEGPKEAGHWNRMALACRIWAVSSVTRQPSRTAGVSWNPPYEPASAGGIGRPARRYVGDDAGCVMGWEALTQK